MAAGSQTGRAPRKRQPAKKTSPPAAAAPPESPAAAPAGGDDLSINQWLHDVVAVPKRVEVFDRQWEFKRPTAGRAVRWDQLIRTPKQGIRAALASMAFDETPSPERRWADASGTEQVLEAVPGSAMADAFLDAASEWLPAEAMDEFWRRIEKAIFGLGEPSAS